MAVIAAQEVHSPGHRQHQWKAQHQHGRKGRRVLRSQAPVKMVKLVNFM